MTYVIAEACVDLKDKACIEECPVDCIYEGNRMLYIQPDECVDCGACEPVCPVEAIYYEDDVPDQWKAYTEANVVFFAELGSPGGASKVGLVDLDAPIVAALAAAGARRISAITATSRSLPDFPWDRLVPFGDRARAHPGGIVDLSVGTPVDPTPVIIQEALRAASDAPGYPLTTGSAALREALTSWAVRRLGAPENVGVLPTIGSKELVALLPSLLALGPGDTVALPELAYPTYAVGALLAGARPVTYGSLLDLGPAQVRMIWVNSPANPTGQVLPVDHLKKIVSWARERDVLVVSDECYLELGWEADPVSVLDPRVCGGDPSGLLAVHSLSKRSNLAGYRAGYVIGDPELVASLLEVRKHAGMIVPAPVQAAMVAALGDDVHVAQQRERYAARRHLLRPALEKAGLRIEHSVGGLYLWATRDEDCWATVGWLADRGILVAPGEFYGPSGSQYVRVALTASDERIGQVSARLS